MVAAGGAQLAAMAAAVGSALYEAPSALFRKDATGNYSVSIGMGLFSNLKYARNNTIVLFVGEVIDHVEYAARVEQGQGGYCIEISNTILLDSYHCRFLEQENREKCMASVANSSVLCWDMTNNRLARPNCRISVNIRTNTVSLKANRVLEIGEELTWSYASSFIMPELVRHNFNRPIQHQN